MIFEPESIDDYLMDLAKRFRKVVNHKPRLSWIKELTTWVISSDSYIEGATISISYDWIRKSKYEVFYSYDEVKRHIGDFSTAKEAVDSICLLKFMEEGVQPAIIEFLANKIKFMELSDAVNKITKEKPEIIILPSEMRILNIDTNQRGTIHGNRFGI